MVAKQSTNILWDIIMRFSSAAIALSLTLAVFSSASIGKKADDEINPLSLSLMTRGMEAKQANDIEGAIDLYETALAVDPRNRAAYLEMARAVASKGLNGKAIRFYKEALELEPNDQLALTEQADVMLAKGAVEQAKNNLARLRLLCQSGCGNVDKLAAAIQNAAEKKILQASAVKGSSAADPMPAKAN